MDKFEITSSTLSSQYNFVNDEVVVNGALNKDAITDTLQNVSGTVYRKNAQGEMGEYVCNFNGYLRDGVINYSISELKRRDVNMVWDAIDAIEKHILPQNAPAE